MGTIRFPAALLVAAVLLAWFPASHAATSFSFSIHGGDFRGYPHGRHFDHYPGLRPYYYPYPRNFGYRYYNRPYWQRGYSHRPYRHDPAPGPRCIYRYGYRYCR